MIETFKTVYKPAVAEIIEKKSRFIGHAFPVSDENEALALLEGVRKEHAKAGHNCFAWQIGEAGRFTRQSDDGEPSGTAGMPILDMLRKEGIQNTLVVVTRYFGGTLLGTGGLVRAYGRAAKEAVNAAVVIDKILHQKYYITCSYHLSGKLQYEILQGDNVLLDTIYTDTVKFVVLTKSFQADRFKKAMVNASSNQAVVEPLEQMYCANIDGKLIQF